MATVEQVTYFPPVVAIVEDALRGVPGGNFSRRTVTVTGTYSSGDQVLTTVRMSLGYRIYEITSTFACRLRLYATAATQTADAARDDNVDPGPGSGVVMDVLLDANDPLILSPQAGGSSLETSPSPYIPLTIDAIDGGAQTITFIWIQTE